MNQPPTDADIERVQQFMATIGGVEGYLLLKHQDPQLMKVLLKAFSVELDDPEPMKLDKTNRRKV